MPQVTVPGAAQYPIYRREQPLPTPEIGVGEAVSEAGQALTQFSEQQQKVKQAYDDMVRKRQQAIMQAQLTEKQIAERERAAKAGEEQAKLDAEAKKVAAETKAVEQTRQFELGEAREAATEKTRLEEETSMGNFRTSIKEEMKEKTLTFEKAISLGNLEGVSETKKFQSFMKTQFPKRYQSPGTVYRFGRQAVQAESAYVNFSIKARQLAQVKSQMETADPKTIKKLITKAGGFGMPGTKELMEMPDEAAKTAGIKMISTAILAFEKEATKSLSIAGKTLNEVPPEWTQQIQEGIEQFLEERPDPLGILE